MGRNTHYICFLAVFTALVATSVPSFADGLPLVIYPRLYNFPGQQLCQVDREDSRYREFCAPQSYHPYGVFGYRPLGSYRHYRHVRRFWVAPDARIVKINPQNQ